MKVLIVDDSQLNLSIVKSYLETIPDITDIILCHASKETKTLIDDNQIDILILDIVMPEFTGLDILALLRSDSKYDDLPIIMLTSLDDLESYKNCFELGAFDYINKPINIIELNARLKVAIEWKNNANHLKSLIEVTKKQNEALKEINAQLTEAKFNLVQSEKMAAIGQLAAGIAHEINNPMGFINSNIDILHKYYLRIADFLLFITEITQKEKVVTNPATHELADEILMKYKALKLDLILSELDGIFIDSTTGIQRVTDIVQSLRVFTRSSADDEKDTNVLLDLIQQVILITRNEVKFIAKVELDIPDDIIIYCNRVQICQVFVNILLNAAQAIASENRKSYGLIKITAKKANQMVAIRFKDDGPGIPEEYRSKIFEPFFTTKEIGQGTGLGLSISYDIIVNKHKGSIEVGSEIGKGTTFTITLPIVTTD
ncbi:MAG TPA: ATP-binding protein [Mobilitalea sp.]|nr:ATP-binding protein [Mobilitalea sp.]